MRLIREARRLECETQRRESRRSHVQKWLAVGHANEDLEDKRQQTDKPLSPPAPSLKKAPSALSQKWSTYIEAMGLKDGAVKARRVRFPVDAAALGQEYERPVWSDDEKARCHYSAQELDEMATVAKKLVHRESRFAGQPEDTILEQGFLTLPAHSHTPFFQNRRFYCLLRGHRLAMYNSAANAAKSSGLKAQFIVLRVQDCQTLSMQKKVALFGATFPTQIGLMFYVIKANGERVVLTADSKASKRNWVHSLTQLTYVGEGDCTSFMHTPPRRPRTNSAPSCHTARVDVLPPVPEVELEDTREDRKTDGVTVFDLNKMERRNSCTAVCG
ncbi:hypothetical protein BBJ28_00018601 [Nothophytophthora sp. Chile5]|nr:hypothetical protein BBJ28_00018601 [Nothophytophthora sp. Chile5]